MLSEQPRRRKQPRVHHLDIARLHPAETKADRLATLEELRDRGVLSQPEYELQRNEVLDEI